LWWEKMAVLGGALLLVWFVLFSGIYFFVHGKARSEEFLEVAGVAFLVALIAFCSAPYFTLICRNFIGGVVFTLIFPWALCLVLMFMAWLSARLTLQPEPWFSGLFEKHPDYFIPTLALIYCAVMYFAGYRLFLNFQVTDVQVKELGLPVALENRLASLVKKIIPGYTGPMASLVRKELQVQRPTFVVAGVMAALIVCSRIVWIETEVSKGLTIAAIAVYMMCAPFIAGVVSMAEERNWGTVGWQLTFPIPVWKQFLVKLVVTYLTAVFLGLVIPLIVILAKNSVSDLIRGEFSTVLAVWLWSYLPVLSLVVYASSVSNNTMRATAVFFGLLIATGVVSELGEHWIYLAIANPLHSNPVLIDGVLRWSHAWHISPVKFFEYVIFGVAILFLCGLMLLIGSMILQNCRSDETNPRRRWIQSSIIVVALGGSMAALMGLINFIVAFEAFNINQIAR
jgi:hypothetical protein